MAASEAGEFIASGYNQTTRGSKKRPILGAVENMVEGATRESKSLYGSVIYLTEPPCLTSAKAIWETGAFRVVYPKGKGGASRIAATKLLAKLGVMLTEFS